MQFATRIENDNTPTAYLRGAREFLAWCGKEKLGRLADIQSIHVAAWIKQSKLTHSVPTVKLRLAAIRHLFDWLVTGHVLQTNPRLPFAAKACRAQGQNAGPRFS